MAELGLNHALQFRNDPLSQHLAQLDSPLVERVKFPNDALREDDVSVQRHQLAQDRRSEPFSQEGIRWTVAYQMDTKPISTGKLRSQGAVRKCSSISWKPASIARKFSGPMASIVERPMAESIE